MRRRIRALLWTNKALMTLAEELQKEGFSVSHVTVGEMLEELGYSLQSNMVSERYWKIYMVVICWITPQSRQKKRNV